MKALFKILIAISMTSIVGIALAAEVTKTVSATYLGYDYVHWLTPAVNKTAFVVGQQYPLFTVTYDDESDCVNDYWDSDGSVKGTFCGVTSPVDWQSDAVFTLSDAVNSALANYAVCPGLKAWHWDHASNWYTGFPDFHYINADSFYDLYWLKAHWNDANLDDETNHVQLDITGHQGGICDPDLVATREYVRLEFGNPFSVVEGSGAVDDDGDGFNSDDDCNDNDASVYPGASELCDGKDNDCDGAAGTDEVDLDQDGFLACEECNDDDAIINPDAIEIYFNLTDENCDGDLGDCSPCYEWENHGHYVRCVAHAVNDLVWSGDLTQEEADGMVSSAAQTEIGKQDYISTACE